MQSFFDSHLIAVPARNENQVRRKAREMSQQQPDGNVALSALKLRQVFSYGVVESNSSLLKQLHNAGRGSYYFGERSRIEDRVEGHGLALRNQRTRAISLAVQNLPVLTDDNDRPRDQARRNSLTYDRVDLRRKPGRRRGRLGAGGDGKTEGNRYQVRT